MLTNITWTQFLITVGSVTFIYYCCVLSLFYKKKLLLFFKDAGQQHSFNQIYAAGDNNEAEPASTLPLSEELTPLVEDLRDTLTQAQLKKFSIEELIFSLQIGMHKYEASLIIANKNVINQFIKDSAQNICSIHLDEERLNQLWIR